MQLNVRIEDVNLQEQLTQYVSKKKIDANELLVELLQHFFYKEQNNTIYQLSKEEIQKTVENFQRIEGYEPVSEEFETEVEAFMLKHNVKVSA